MRAQWSTIGLLIPAISAVLIAATSARGSPVVLSNTHISRQTDVKSPTLLTRNNLIVRDGHGHHNAHGAPLLRLNETEVTMYHAPTPPSYWTIDIDGIDIDGNNLDASRHPGLMMLHGVLMSLAFFVALPICE